MYFTYTNKESILLAKKTINFKESNQSFTYLPGPWVLPPFLRSTFFWVLPSTTLTTSTAWPPPLRSPSPTSSSTRTTSSRNRPWSFLGNFRAELSTCPEDVFPTLKVRLCVSSRQIRDSLGSITSRVGQIRLQESVIFLISVKSVCLIKLSSC